MLASLTPGTLLQFWEFDDDYQRIKARTGGPAEGHIGHSPIFSKFMPDDPLTGQPREIVVIDQDGDTNCVIQGTAPNRRIKWHTRSPEILGCRDHRRVTRKPERGR